MNEEELANWLLMLMSEDDENVNLALALAPNLPREQIIYGLICKILWLHSYRNNYYSYKHQLQTIISLLNESNIEIPPNNIDRENSIEDWFADFVQKNPLVSEAKLLETALPHLDWLFEQILVTEKYHKMLSVRAWRRALQVYEAIKADDTELYVVRYPISSLPEAFFELRSLRFLSVYYVPLTHLPIGLLYQLQNLEKLHLKNSKIPKLSLDLRRMPHLRELAFSNGERLLGLDLEGVEQLRMLDISGNPIKRLPMWIWELKNLEELHLNNMNLAHFPPALLALTQLKSLSMRGTNFTSFPPKFAKLNQLQILDLSDSHWSDLPDFFADFTQLATLKINRCNFKAFPAVLYRMRGLRHLEISHNFIRHLDTVQLVPFLSQLRSLKIVEAFSTAAMQREFEAVVPKNMKYEI
jgi:Leucine-rich repeat (LRR) protein